MHGLAVSPRLCHHSIKARWIQVDQSNAGAVLGRAYTETRSGCRFTDAAFCRSDGNGQHLASSSEAKRCQLYREGRVFTVKPRKDDPQELRAESVLTDRSALQQVPATFP